MITQLLVSPDKLSVVQLRMGRYWLRLALRLSHEFMGGELVRFAHDAVVSIKGSDKLSSSYTQANWVSGVASGALYAFRTLRIPRQCLVLTELSGRLRASHMDALANGSAIAIAKLAEKELPSLRTEGWTVQVQIDRGRPILLGMDMNLDDQRLLQYLSVGNEIETRLTETPVGDREYFPFWSGSFVPGLEEMSELGMIKLLKTLHQRGLITRHESVCAWDACEYQVRWGSAN